MDDEFQFVVGFFSEMSTGAIGGIRLPMDYNCERFNRVPHACMLMLQITLYRISTRTIALKNKIALRRITTNHGRR